MIWSYGVTTVPSRVDTLLPITLASLTRAGFSSPHLFVDGASDSSLYDHLRLRVTTRWPAIRTFGNWFTSLLELYIREPYADRYAIFQDDLIGYTNLRGYLEQQVLPERGYWNLFTFPRTRQKPPPSDTYRGWYPSNQRGQGALALVFNRECVLTLIKSDHMLERPRSIIEDNHKCINYDNNKTEVWYKGHKSVDGGVATSLEKAGGWTEYVHWPSLVEHAGNKVSSMHNMEYPQAGLFLGQDHDALSFLSQVS